MDEQEPAISVAVLVRLRADTGDEDGELMRELVEVFSNDATASCERLPEFLAAGNMPAVSREAHRLKSGAANMGAMKMAALCTEIEDAAERADQAAVAHGVSQLVKEGPRAVAGLQAHLETL